MAQKTLALLLVVLFVGGCTKRPSKFPSTEKRPVSDTYYNITIMDNYRWLDYTSDSTVREWNNEQNAFSRAYFDGIGSLTTIRERVQEIMGRAAVAYYGLSTRTYFFAMKYQPPLNQAMIVMLPTPGDTSGERVVVDPNSMNPLGTTAIDWYRPSHDGKHLAVSISENGSEDGTLYVFDVATGKKTGDVVPRVQYPTASGSVEWARDNSGFYYTRYPQGAERSKEDASFYQQIYFHGLGTPASQDRYVIGKEFPRIAECALSSSPDGKYLLLSVSNGDGGEFAFYLMPPGEAWCQVAQCKDKIVGARIGHDQRLYLLSHAGAPKGKILALPLARPVLENAVTVVPEGEVSITEFLPAEHRLYVAGISGGPARFRVCNLHGNQEENIDIPAIASVGGLTWLKGDRILYESQTYLTPAIWYDYDPNLGLSKRTTLSETPTVDFSDCEVLREFAVSKDGTSVPLNIIRKKESPQNGTVPTILYGYGGYGISMEPGYNPLLRLWLEQGGSYAIANLRGGSEYGDAWHEAGKLTKKQNVFDDFIACAQFLVEKKFTSVEKLAIEGGSNGGLLMGAVMTQRPDLFRAVVSYVGIYDMLRVELFPNGAFNVTEFGSVKVPDQFKALFAYSPYHHVVEGTQYPAVLFLTGDNDGRVDPANSRKMLALLQVSTTSGLPVLLRTDAQAGHGIGTGLSSRVAEESDVLAFLIDQLGIHYAPSRK